MQSLPIGTRILSNLVAILLIASAAASAQPLPRFEGYPANNIFKNEPAPVDLASNPKASQFRTRLQASAKEGPNFAGHYTFIDWGCGTGCTSFAIVDAKTGGVLFLSGEVNFPWLSDEPATMEKYDISYRIDSRLLIINGVPGERKELGTYYYELTDGILQLIRFIEWKSTWNIK